MLKTSLAVIVALCAVFVGAIWYNTYLPISDELKGDQKAIPFLFHFNEFLARIVSDRLGLLPKYKFFRWYFTSISTSTFLAKPNTEGISIEESIISGVPVKIFRPKETQSDNQDNWLPGVIYVHGGGLILGSVNFTCYIEQCAMIARGELVIFQVILNKANISNTLLLTSQYEIHQYSQLCLTPNSFTF